VIRRTAPQIQEPDLPRILWVTQIDDREVFSERPPPSRAPGAIKSRVHVSVDVLDGIGSKTTVVAPLLVIR